jgi:glutamine transport system substrate-binding protein
MNRLVKRSLAALSAVVFAAVGVMATVPAASAAEKTVTVVTDPSFVPFESLDTKTGKYVGFDMDIIRAIAKRAGFKYQLKTMDFNGIIPALQAGSVDIAIAGITITKERAKKIDFSQPYYDSGLRIMVRANNDSIKTVKDFAGKSVSTKIGSTSYNYLTTKVPGIGKVVPFPGTSQMYMALMTGNVDAAFYDAPNVLYFIKTKGHGKVKTVGPLYAGQKYGIAFPKGSPLVKSVNAALESMKKDGTFATIYKKWFGAEPPADLTK